MGGLLGMIDPQPQQPQPPSPMFSTPQPRQPQQEESWVSRLTGIPSSDRTGQNRAFGMALLNAGGAVANANRPGASFGSLLGQGAVGFGGGLEQQHLARIRESGQQMQQIQEQHKMQQAEAKALREQQKHDFEMGGGDTYRDMQKSWASKGMYLDPVTGQISAIPGWSDVNAANVGSEAYARGMYTPLTVEPGGQVVVPGLGAGGRGMPGGGAKPISVPQPFQSAMQNAANTYGIPQDVLARVVQAESNFNPQAVSPKGAIGLMQLMPGTAKELRINPNDPYQNIWGGTAYLKQQLDKYGSLPLALAAYNWGPGHVDEWQKNGGDWNKLPSETRKYINKVMGWDAAENVASSPGQAQAANSNVVYQDQRPMNAGTEENAFSKRMGEKSAEWLYSLGEQAEMSDATLNNIDAMFQQLDSGLRTDRLMDAKVAVSALADSFGIDPNKLGLADATSAQIFQSNVMKNLLDELIKQKGPQTEGDAERALKTFPQLSNTTEANRWMLQYAKNLHERRLQQYEFISERMLANNGNKVAAEKAWREHKKTLPSIVPPPPAGAPQAPQAAPPAQPAQSNGWRDM